MDGDGDEDDDDARLYDAAAECEQWLDDADDEIMYNAVNDFEQSLVRAADDRTPPQGSFSFIFKLINVLVTFRSTLYSVFNLQF